MKAAILAVVAGIAMMACTQTAPPANHRQRRRPPGGGGGTGPTPQGDEQTEKSWKISAAHFGDDGSNLLSATSNRSAPYAWDRITGGDDVVQLVEE